jgi:hypothetical protein
MHVSVTLGGRAHFAALLHSLTHAAEQRKGSPRLDRRNQRTWRQVILGVLVQRSTRLLALGRFVAPQRRANSVKAAAQGLAYFLKDAAFPVAEVSTGLLEEAVRQIDPARLVTYEGKVLLVLDPTEYAKRSRGQGKCGRHMQHIGRVRAPKAKTSAGKKRTKQTRTTPATPQPAKGTPAAPTQKTAQRVATTYGYVDIWAGLALTGKQFLPLARQLFSSRHPTCTSQNAVEEAVLGQALDLLQRLGLPAIVLGDRGVGRKELLIRLAKRDQAAVLRVDADSTVYPSDAPDGQLLADALAQQPWRGTVTWDRGEYGRCRCRLRTLRAPIRFSRTGRKGAVQEATLTFVEAVPRDGRTESLVLATTLPVDTPAQARAIVRLYAQRWAIETAFETMHAWGQERFMVRSWTAIDRLLWVLAVAYALVVLALHRRSLRRFRAQAIALLKALSVVGDQLTAGKLAEAIGLDFARHARAWLSVWLL